MNYINWDEYFMGVALLSARRSKDPNTKVGACIVSQEKKIVGVGYNGMPYGCDDATFPWGSTENELESKYLYVVHAELNAILNSSSKLNDCTIYSALFPCNECCKAIIQSGIKKIVYLSDKYETSNSVRAGKRMLDAAGVTYLPLESDIKELTLTYDAGKV